MGNCAKLKWNRKRLGLSQKEFAEKVGVCQYTICKLERDETAWATIKAATEDKIYAAFDSMASWQPERADKVIQEIAEEIDILEDNNMHVESNNADKTCTNAEKVVYAGDNYTSFEKCDFLTDQDKKSLTLIEFAYEGLTEATSHSEFVANVNMLKRVLNKY